MKKILILLIPVFVLLGAVNTGYSQDPDQDSTKTENVDDHNKGEHEAGAHEEGAHANHGDHHLPPGYIAIPFVLLLLLIATGPLFFEHFWHKNYPLIAIALGAGVVGYYMWVMHDVDTIIHTLAEYIQFIALLTGLFCAAGGIMIKVDKKGKPMTNAVLLAIGAVLANIIGTTGASMLLIRPFIRLNKDRIKAYHIVFFIFIVSNVGGSLTPIGDPPLFLGFLKGVPFEWTMTHDLVPWVFGVIMLLIIFIMIDSRNKSGEETEVEYTGKTKIVGTKNFFWIIIIIGAVFLDPNVFSWVPGIKMTLHGQDVTISFLRECIMLSAAFLSYYFSSEKALKGNEFEFEPIKEVAFLFVGIFFTMMPALAIVGDYATNNPDLISKHSLYWATGALSGVLDNAPTYVNFLTAAMAAQGGDVGVFAEVQAFSTFHITVDNAAGQPFPGPHMHDDHMTAAVRLTAISVASVFFGAMTYIGNAPNFMVKAIAEQAGVKMPSFFAYVVKYSMVYLLPVLALTWLIFFQFDLVEIIIDFFHIP